MVLRMLKAEYGGTAAKSGARAPPEAARAGAGAGATSDTVAGSGDTSAATEETERTTLGCGSCKHSTARLSAFNGNVLQLCTWYSARLRYEAPDKRTPRH